MSINGEIERIQNNVSDALAATAEKGASVPEGATSDNLGTLIRSIPTSGGTSINVTAEVGQTIVAKSVDENGKPTAWESAEYQPRTHWSETTEILPETNIPFVESIEGFRTEIYWQHLAIEDGKTYTVVYNGAAYTTSAVQTSEGEFALGNLGAVNDSFADTGEPFCIAISLGQYAEEDWNGDITYGDFTEIAVKSLDGSSAVTLSIGEEVVHKIPVKYLPGGTGGGASINVTASVGQTIVVKEVDADGKPTAWESAEYQPRTHWSEPPVEILPEITVEIDPDSGMGEIPAEFILEVGKKYKVMYNGVEYADCVCEYQPGYVFVGNAAALDTSFPNTEQPFLIVSSMGTRVVIPADGSTTVTLSITEEVVKKIPTKYLPDGIPWSETGITKLLPETSIVFDVGQYFHMKKIGLTVGKNYTVKWNETEYNCIAQNVYEEGVLAGVALGNVDQMMGGEGTGEPFVVMEFTPSYVMQGGILVAIYSLDGSESAVLSIVGEGEIIHPIPEQYLPQQQYVYEISRDKFEEVRDENDRIVRYSAYVSEMPSALLKAMLQNIPVFLKVTEKLENYAFDNSWNAPASYYAPGNISKEKLEEVFGVGWEEQDTLSIGGIANTLHLRLGAPMFTLFTGFEYFYVTFTDGDYD